MIRNRILTPSFHRLCSLLEDNDSYDVLINVPLSQLCQDDVILDADKPRIFSIILHLVVCEKTPVNEVNGAVRYLPSCIVLSDDIQYSNAERQMIHRYAELMDIAVLRNFNDDDFEKSITGGLSKKSDSITNRSESLLGYVTQTSLHRGFVMSFECGISSIVQPTQFDDYDAKNMWKNGSTDMLVLDRHSGQAVLAIEYDGPHHLNTIKQRKDDAKDNLLLSSGVPTLRIKSKNLYKGSHYRFAAGSFELQVVMLLIELLLDNTMKQREKLTILRKQILSYLERGREVDQLDFEYALSFVDDIGLEEYWESKLGGIEQDYHKIYFDAGLALPKRNISIVPRPNNVYEVTASINGYEFDACVQCNYGHLEFWSSFYKTDGQFVSLLEQAVVYVLLDVDFRQRKLDFENHGLKFASPLNARLSLKYPTERERYKSRKKEADDERRKEALKMLDDPSHHKDNNHH